ncbi:MAG TPA: hypothetical protein VN838_10240, partial [Bradyrhizobium sp.]|nr:hypothetical protein [Bradyrhizobium sp.]
FFSALAAKFPNESIPAEVLEAMRHAAVTLAARDPTTAFLFLAQEGREQRRVPLQLLDGVATGLAESETELLEGLTTLVPDLAIALISEKPTLARRLVVEVKRSPAPSILSVGNILSSATDEMREPARSSLAPYLDSDSLAPLLTPLLSGATGQEVVDFAVNIGRGSDFAAAAFDKPIKDAAQSQGSLLKLRNAVAREFHSANSNRFITSTLHPNRDEVTWICDSLTEDRARNVLLRLLQTTPEYSFHDVVHDPALGGRVLDILARDLPSEAAVVATLLTQANVSIDRLLEIGERALPFLQTNDKHKLVIHLVSRALSEAAISDTRVSSLIEQVGTDTPATNLIALATKENASSSRIAENILILERASPSTRMSIVTHIDHLSGRLANTRLGNLGQAAYEAWAKMIVDTPNKEVQFNAASLALNYALQRKEFPVTSLIIAAFPIVYVELLRSKEGDELSIPAFLMLPLSFFVDWDRARSAREGLVEAFMNSNWPPADLVLTVSEVNLEKWVFEHLSRSRMGRNYVARIEADLPRLDTPQQRRIRKNVDQLFS